MGLAKTIYKAVATPKPMTPEEEISKLEAEEYAELAKKLGIDQKPLDRAMAKTVLLRWLQEKGHKVYDRERVERFLNRMADDRPIVWRPLRSCDAGASPLIYDKPVPIHVLILVSDIEDDLGKMNYSFLVNDYAMRNPDPFLLAVPAGAPGGYGVVIAHWDEPGFKDKGE